MQDTRDLIQESYVDVFGQRHEASPEAIRAIRKALGVEENTDDLPPVIVVWDQGRLSLPKPKGKWTLVLENGENLDSLAKKLPYGYHHLIVKTGNIESDTLVISAPSKAYLSSERKKKSWGLFLPLYSLRTETNWGIGDYRDLESFGDAIHGAGGDIVSTLPLLPIDFEEDHDPSPYSPISRQFWGEHYIDVTDTPEFQACKPAQKIFQSASFQELLRSTRKASHVEYRTLHQMKMKLLGELAKTFFEKHHVESDPRLEEYARFRARHETDEKVYLYAQSVARAQIQNVSKALKKRSQMLYLDFPIGVSQHGFDAWKEKDLFAFDIDVGAPPDFFFRRGQNWNFPPLHPEKSRRQHYRYLIACLRHHMRNADILRIDHVMGLHRLFWIPRGFSSKHGVYVKYPSDEIYAIYCLESQRSKTELVGENLGTVPAHVNRTMKQHGLAQSYLASTKLGKNGSWVPVRPAKDSLASLNTHDTPTFSSFWRGMNADTKKDLIDYFAKKNWLVGKSTPLKALRAWLAFLAASPARFLLINLEDLWLEKKSQNTPGVSKSKTNWQRKAAYKIDDLSHLNEVEDTLETVRRLRKGEGIGRT